MDVLCLLPVIAVLAGSAIIAGLMAGLLGVGGGIVIVPVIYYAFTSFGLGGESLMHVAIGTSLATIVATSVSSVRSHHKKGAIDWPLVSKLSIGVVIGVVIGTLVAAQVSGDVLRGLFAILAFSVAIKMLRGKKTRPEDQQERTIGRLASLGFGTVIGSLSVMVGIGGGSLTVPILRHFSVHIRKAVACASAIGFVIAVPGAIGFILAGIGQADLPQGSVGYVNFIAFAVIVPITVTFAPVGAGLAHRLDPARLQKGFGLFLLIVSAEMFWDVFGNKFM